MSPEVPAPATKTHEGHTPGAPHYTATALSPDPSDLPGLRGAGSPTPPSPPRPALPGSARSGPARPSPPALTAPTAPVAPPLPRLLPHPLPAEATPPDPSRAGPGGSEHVGAFAPGTGSCSSRAPRRAGACLGSGRFGPLGVPDADRLPGSASCTSCWRSQARPLRPLARSSLLPFCFLFLIFCLFCF